MTVGARPVADGAVAELPNGVDASTPNAFRELLADSDAEFIYLLHAKPYAAGTSRTAGGLPAPVASQPVAAGPTLTVSGGEITVRLSDKGYRTEPSETPANQNWAARLVSPYEVSISAFGSDEPESAAQGGQGNIEIANEGGLDNWASYAWDGREVEILVGAKGFTFSQFATVFLGTADDIEAIETRITVRLRDRQFLFDQNIQTNLYGGTGGADGNSDLAGQPKPLAFGRIRNIRPITVDESALTYQVHDGQVNDIDAVRDQGVALTDAGDFATYALLAAATTGGAGSGADIEAGEFATCLAEGFFRLGGSPSGQVTADVKGDADGTYVTSTADIIRRIVTKRMGAFSLDDPEDLDTATFAAVSTVNSATVGIYVSTERRVAEVIDDLLRSVAGFRAFSRDGLFQVYALEAPSSAVKTFTDADIGQGGIERLRAPLPSWRRRMGWRRMWRVQENDDLAGSVSAANRELYGNQYRFASASDTAIRSKHRLARDVDVSAFFDVEADASTEATRQQTLFGSDRQLYRVSVERAIFRYWLGDVVRLEIDRFGLGSGKNFTVVGVEEDVRSNETILTLWG